VAIARRCAGRWQNAVETLLFGAATGILIAVLIQYYKAKEGH
jgi:hypothetical protein